MSTRVAIFGCGSISRGHVQRFLSLPEVEIVACADPNPAATDAVSQAVERARGTKPACFASPEEALAARAVDAAAIFTPHTLHFPHAIAALNAGAHVLLEKPMVCSVADAEALVERAREKGKVLAVAYQMRLRPAFQRLRDIIRSGALGELRVVAALLTQDWIERITASNRTWRFNPALSGGGELMDSGSHVLDILLWATGLEPEEVFAFMDNRHLEVDVLSASSLRFRGGVLGTFTISGDAPGWTSSLTFTGTEGTLIVRDNTMVLMKKGAEPEVMDAVLELPAGASPAENFIRAIRGEEAPVCPGEGALPVVRTTQALYRSAAEGRPVRVGE